MAAATARVQAGEHAVFLLHGVTGSGKTEVYLRILEEARALGKSAIVLVPEINLTPQFAQRIAQALPGRRTVTLHSRLAAGERARNWRAAAEGEADLVLGTRLAAFAPLPRLALVVVDEEHDPSFKQQEGVRYHGRDVAIWRAHRRGVPIARSDIEQAAAAAVAASPQDTALFLFQKTVELFCRELPE